MMLFPFNFGFHLQTVLDSVGVSIWQMAVAPCSNDTESKSHPVGNGFIKANSTGPDDPETSDSEDDSDSDETNEQSVVEYPRVALACDDGCVRIYSITDTDEFVYTKSLPRVGGENLLLLVVLACGIFCFCALILSFVCKFLFRAFYHVVFFRTCFECGMES